jgi:iron(III) transport system ATP-binding protein
MSEPIRLDGISKRFGTTAAVRDLSLTVAAGEVVALIGPSGGGKSTTLRLVVGFERPDAGTIGIGPRVVVGPGQFVPPERRGVGMVFQDYALFPHLTAAQNIAFGLHRRSASERTQRVAEVLGLVGLSGLGERYPHQLSGGQQQRVALARALAPEPAVLLLDEPLSSLDADLRARTRQELARVLRATGVTTVVVTHDQQEAFMLADRVGILINGVLDQVGTPDAVYESPTSRAVAEFVGEANFLPAQVRGASLHTEVGVLPNPGLADGALVDVMVRPDDVATVPDPDGIAVVLERQYRGEEVAYALRLPSGRVMHTHVRHDLPYTPGTRLSLVLSPRGVVAFGPAD